MTAWYILTVTSGHESAAESLLGRLGYEEAWHPVRWVDPRPAARKRRSKADTPRRVARAWVPGYVFVYTDNIEAHRINGSHGRIHMRVLCPGGVPYRLSDDDMARMADVPKRVRDLVQAVREQERAERLAKRPVEGQPARITEGPMAGVVGIVTSIHAGVVRFENAEPVPMAAPLDRCERVAV